MRKENRCHGWGRTSFRVPVTPGASPSGRSRVRGGWRVPCGQKKSADVSESHAKDNGLFTIDAVSARFFRFSEITTAIPWYYGKTIEKARDNR